MPIRSQLLSHVLGKAAMLLACLSVTACAFTDSTVDGRYDTINRSTDAARNQAILLNIVRASRAEPLNFVAFSKIGGTTSAGMGIGLPSFIVGPDRAPNQKQTSFGNSTLNGSVSANSNFDIAILENRDFYSALLTPVDDVTLNFFERQGYPRELLFWLFADSVRVTQGAKTVEFRNEPSEEKSCETLGPHRWCFVNYVDAAIDTGFRVETRVVERQQTGSDGRSRSVPKTEGRSCFDPVLADRAKREVEQGLRQRRPRTVAQGLNPICGKTPWPKTDAGDGGRRKASGGAPDGMASNRLIVQSSPPQERLPALRSLPGESGPRTYPGAQQVFEISTRSTYGIYQYLGRILSEGAMSRVRLDEHGKEDAQVLTIIEGGSVPCFTEVEDFGKHYCVPAEGAENTKRIISLLAQLLALKTPQSDLPFTPTVRLTP